MTRVKLGTRTARTLDAVNPSASPEVLRTAAGVLLSGAAVQSLLDAAARLQAAAQAGHPPRALLTGKNLAVLQPMDGASTALHIATVELGLRVSQVSLGHPLPVSGELARIARMLGQLYDAIDVGAAPIAAAAELAAHAGVPVYRGLADGSHPALALVPQPGNGAVQHDTRWPHFMLQALLLATIG